MEGLKIYSEKTVEKLISRREGEIKYGEKLCFIEEISELASSMADFVLFGIPEDIGVRANHGKPGTSKAWQFCLQALLNIQKNGYTSPENLILLGEINCKNQMQQAGNIDQDDPNYFQKLGDLVAEIDEMVIQVIKKIVSAGKIPIIIGGGHNNAFGNIKGSSKALGRPVNLLNIDAHTDLRKTDYRHSGNGFTYARKNGFLGKYGIFALSQNYTPNYIFEEIKNSKNTEFQLFENLLGQSAQGVFSAYNDILEFVRNEDFGLELDCDVIKDFPASAQSPTGLSIEQVRHFIAEAARLPQCRYFHICEAAPLSENPMQTGKALANFIVDFQNNRS